MFDGAISTARTSAGEPGFVKPVTRSPSTTNAPSEIRFGVSYWIMLGELVENASRLNLLWAGHPMPTLGAGVSA